MLENYLCCHSFGSWKPPLHSSFKFFLEAIWLDISFCTNSTAVYYSLWIFWLHFCLSNQVFSASFLIFNGNIPFFSVWLSPGFSSLPSLHSYWHPLTPPSRPMTLWINCSSLQWSLSVLPDCKPIFSFSFFLLFFKYFKRMVGFPPSPFRCWALRSCAPLQSAKHAGPRNMIRCSTTPKILMQIFAKDQSWKIEREWDIREML